MEYPYTQSTSHTPFADLDLLLAESDGELEPGRDAEDATDEREAALNEQILAALVSP